MASNPQPVSTTAPGTWEATLTVQIKAYRVTDPASLYYGQWVLVRSDGEESGYLEPEFVGEQLVEWGVAPEHAHGAWDDDVKEQGQ